MSATADVTPPTGVPLTKPTAACDVVMKGGITSGVIYPKALRLLGTHYRLQGLGGASAGAIGAAVGAAAEYGRANGGFDKLDALPAQLADGKLAALFQPQPRTNKLLGLMLTAAGADGRPVVKGFRKVRRVVAKLIASFPVAGLIGVVPGVVCIVVGAIERGVAGWLLVVAGVLLAVVGWLVAVLVRLYRLFTVDVPGNNFGICSGLSTAVGSPGFTDWLATQIDVIAGRQAPDGPPGPPLTFGQLWEAGEVPDVERQIDLRLITTCLNEGKPYEMPFEARRFFFRKSDWEMLFPKNVVDALVRTPAALVPSDGSDEDGSTAAEREWDWETQQAKEQGLFRLPGPADLPVIVAVRMSLSFPLLISAVPLWTINRRDPANQQASRTFDDSETEATLKFSQVWFTDGGFCSNFPVDLFDSALPSRPTFAINLGRFAKDKKPHPDDPTKDVEWATSNRSSLLPQFTEIPTSGVAAIGAFGSAAFNTARNWRDTVYLNQPGHRDRIVRVNQTKLEGGLNLHMKGEVIDVLARRGEAAGLVMQNQFNEVHYANDSTGWDNHRWVRYRALLSTLPAWLDSYRRGMAAFEVKPASPPSYQLSVPGLHLANELQTKLDELAALIQNASHQAVSDLTASPRPLGTIRRIPRI
jgi:predicted acylesterase/phospholipase RssA